MQTVSNKRKPSALLVSMPWTNLTEPSLGLGLLKAILTRNGIDCRVLHLNIFLLKYLKYTTYGVLAHSYALCDFLFTGILDQTVTAKQTAVLKQTLRNLILGKVINPDLYGGFDQLVALLFRLRRELIPKWLEECLEEISAHDVSFIGFTCMFDQTISSVALAKLIKEKDPDKLIALGGYAIRSPTAEMIMDCYPWIDAICVGEGEHTIVDLVRASAGLVPLDQVAGIVYRSGSREVIRTRTPGPIDLNANPAPEYDDFFSDLRRLTDEFQVKIRPPVLPMENSRGCWWGAKSHCVFCGIKDSDLTYRAMESDAVLANMAELNRKYGINAFRFSDYILPNEYFNTLLPAIVKIGSPYHISTEMKSNITADKFQLLARAGFLEVQPEIESFNSNVLRKMKKGVTGIQNVFTLMLGKRHTVRILYNILFGFPGDVEDEYVDLLKILPRLMHLDPPMTYIEVKITRWAPLHLQPEAFGIGPPEPENVYQMLFSGEYLEKTGFRMEDFCYYFERNFRNSAGLRDLYNEISTVIDLWRRNRHKARLYRRCDPSGRLEIHDSRAGEERVFLIDSLCDAILRAAAVPVMVSTLHEQLPGLAQRCIDDSISFLDNKGLIFREENRLLSLVLDE